MRENKIIKGWVVGWYSDKFFFFLPWASAHHRPLIVPSLMSNMPFLLSERIHSLEERGSTFDAKRDKALSRGEGQRAVTFFF